MTVRRWSVYSNLIFPWLCDWALDQPAVAEHRREQLSQVSGEVLEIGIGTGLNLACYPKSIRKITAIEPNAGMNQRLERRIREAGIQVDLSKSVGESLPFAVESFDFVVSTFTLCSIANLEMAIKELYRVLKPGGRFVFLEHGLSPDPGVSKWQRRLNPVQRLLGDGCRLDVDVRREITAVPLRLTATTNFYLDQTPRTHGYLYRGTAIK